MRKKCGRQPLSQATLLRRIVAEADSCIGLPHPSASLRFGHETVLLPLVCLMGINGYGLATDDIAKLDRRGWADYRVFPRPAGEPRRGHPAPEGSQGALLPLGRREAVPAGPHRRT